MEKKKETKVKNNRTKSMIIIDRPSYFLVKTMIGDKIACPETKLRDEEELHEFIGEWTGSSTIKIIDHTFLKNKYT